MTQTIVKTPQQIEIEKLQAFIAKTEAEQKKDFEEIVAKYGPNGSKAQRDIVMEKGLQYDEVAKKRFVYIRCSVCQVEEKTYTSDLWQKDTCKLHSKERANQRRKGKTQLKGTKMDADAARARLLELMSKGTDGDESEAGDEEAQG